MSTDVLRPQSTGRPASGSPDRPAGRGRWLALIVLSLAQLMVVLDGTVVNIALPHAQTALGLSNDDRQWIITGYSLAFGALLLLGGRLSDYIGRKPMFVVGLIGFAAASAIGGASTSFTMLLAARILQGVFGAILAPAALSLLSTTFTEPAERGRAFGIYGAISGAGGAVGLLLGGALTQYISWRWCLYVNVVIAVVAVIGAFLFLHSGEKAVRSKLDIPGTVTAVLGVVGLVYGLGSAEGHGWTSAVTLVPIAVGLVLLIGFVLIERRSTHALLPLRVVADRTRGASYLAVAISGAAMFAVFLFLTFYLQGLRQYTPVQTGISFLPMVGAIMVGAIVAGSVLLPKVGPRPLVTAGALIGAVGMVLLTGIDRDSSYAGGILPGLLVMGLGMGLIFGPVQNAATGGVQPHDAGVASALVNTVQQIGGSIGTAVFSSLAAGAATDYVTNHSAANPLILQADAQLAGYHLVFWCAAGLFAACAIMAALLFKRGTLEIDPTAPRAMAH